MNRSTNFYARQHICCSAYMLSPVRLSVRHTGSVSPTCSHLIESSMLPPCRPGKPDGTCVGCVTRRLRGPPSCGEELPSGETDHLCVDQDRQPARQATRPPRHPTHTCYASHHCVVRSQDGSYYRSPVSQASQTQTPGSTLQEA